MISKKTVLTSAQCVHNFNFEKDWYVSPLIGDLNNLEKNIITWDKFGDLLNVEAIHIHEEFSLSSLQNDLAALTTTKDILTKEHKDIYVSFDIYKGDLKREYEADNGKYSVFIIVLAQAWSNVKYTGSGGCPKMH